MLLIVVSYIRRLIGNLQEDNYIGYALEFNQNLKYLDYYDSRLYPGYPILIFLFNLFIKNIYASSYTVIFISVFLSYICLGKIIKQRNNLFLFLFPPIMLDISTRIVNEYLTIFLILLSVYFFFNKKYTLASFFTGLGIWVRPVGLLLFPAIFFGLFKYKKEKLTPNIFLAFLIPVIIFAFYNFYFFRNPSPFYQLMVYKNVSPYGNSVGFIQVIKDLFRVIHWGQYNILLSGIFYVGLFVIGIKKIIKNLGLFNTINQVFIVYSMLFITLFVFAYSFNPFLENLARYITPLILLWWILFGDKIKIPNIAYLLTVLSVAVSLF